MTYPESSDVSAGQPTAVVHYNNLRADALRFGQAEADAVNLGALFARFVDNINLVYLATNRVRVVATPGSPVSIMVNGYPLRTIANVDLPVGSTPSGVAATYYVFAVRTAGSSIFTLEVNTSPTEWADVRLIGSFYWDGSAIVQNTISTVYRDYLADLLNFNPPLAAQGRLSLSATDAVSASDITGGTLYFIPYKGNTIYLFSSIFGWVPYSIDALSLSFAGAATATNYDLFAYFNGTAVVMEKVAWSNDTTRATAIILQNGRYVKSGATDRLYLGTVRTISTGNIADTLLNRYVWNFFNRVPRIFKLRDTTASWSVINNATYAQMRSTAANKIEFVIGVAEEPVQVFHTVQGISATGCYVSLGLDAVNAIAADSHEAYCLNASGDDLQVSYCGFPGIGYHYIAPIEHSVNPGTASFYCGAGGKSQLLTGEILA